MRNNIVRNSGIELYKLLGIILIVFSHVVQSLGGGDLNYFAKASSDVQQLTNTIFSYCGTVGNMIFFVSSAYFLIRSKRVNKKKILTMLLAMA